MSDLTESKGQTPTLSFDGNLYDLSDPSDELKELVRGLQVADGQLQMHHDTLNVLAVGRQSLADKLKEYLKDVEPLPTE